MSKGGKSRRAQVISLMYVQSSVPQDLVRNQWTDRMRRAYRSNILLLESRLK